VTTEELDEASSALAEFLDTIPAGKDPRQVRFERAHKLWGEKKNKKTACRYESAATAFFGTTASLAAVLQEIKEAGL
jgi:hypothetical protein